MPPSGEPRKGPIEWSVDRAYVSRLHHAACARAALRFVAPVARRHARAPLRFRLAANLGRAGVSPAGSRHRISGGSRPFHLPELSRRTEQIPKNSVPLADPQNKLTTDSRF